MNPLLQPAVALAARLLVRTNARTHRVTVANRERIDELSGRPCILALWHCQLLESLSFVFNELIGKRPITIMISQSRDGDFVTKIVRTWGVRVHRGSATRGGSRALRGLYRELTKEAASPALLVDGPQGPARVAKPGAIVLGQTSGAPILPLAFSAKRGIRFGSWDRMMWPLPFSVIGAAIGRPIEVPKQLSEGQRKELQVDLGHQLDALEQEAIQQRS